MDLKKYFERKKRELSSQSTSDSEEAKRLRESSFDDSVGSAANCDVFVEGFKSEDCVAILCNCMKNVEEELKRLGKKFEENEIKGERQHEKLTESITSLSNKIDDYERERLEKEKVIKSKKDEIETLTNKIESLEKCSDDHEQYSRRNCLVLHGITEKDDEDTDQIVLDVIKEKMDITVTEADLDRSHRIGDKTKKRKKPRAIIIKFSRYNVRKKVFTNKKSLKGSNISITESLTKKRLEILKEARIKHQFENVWTSDGKILFEDTNDNKVKVYYS